MNSENSYLKSLREKELKVVKPLTEAQKECMGYILNHSLPGDKVTKQDFIRVFGPLGVHILEELLHLKQIELVDGILYIKEN